MRIIVLQGKSNKGKTTTLNLVWKSLTESGVGVSTNRQPPYENDKKDFSDIVMIGDRKIAFYSIGDFSKDLQSAVNKYFEEGCGMLICALSIGKDNVKANQALNKFNAKRINKTIVVGKDPAMFEDANKDDAEIIFNMIIALCEAADA